MMTMDKVRGKIKERRKETVDKDDDLSFEAILIMIDEWHEMKNEIEHLRKEKKDKDKKG